MPDRLTNAQLRQFGKDGYLPALPLFPYREIKPIRRALEHYEAMNGSVPRQRVRERLSCFKAHLLFPWLDAICHHPRILDAVESIIGPDILIFGSGVIMKNVGDDVSVPWNQPAASMPFTGGAQVRVVIAFSDSPAGSGCTRVVPGSHLEMLEHEAAARDTWDALLWPRKIADRIDASKALPLAMKAGEAAILDNQLAISACPNWADDRRIAYEVTYVTPDSLPDGLSETATLARGEVGAGTWMLEPRPEASADPYAKPSKAAVTAHATAMAVRRKNVLGRAGISDGRGNAPAP